MIQLGENMKFSQLLIAICLGLVLFTGLYLAESTRSKQQKDIVNPFEDTTVLPEIIIPDGVTTIFNDQRELWQFQPESEAHFAEGKREIIDGTVFMSFNFLSNQDLTTAREFTSENFSLSNHTVAAGQVQVNSIMINAPGASFFVMRDRDTSKTTIQTYDHAIDIWFPESSTPFVLAPRHQIIINDRVVGRLGKLYYTKLKKDLRAQPFIPDTEDPVISHALKARKEKLNEITSFASKIPGSWFWFAPDSLMGQVSNVIRYLQSDYALGISQEFRKKYQFDRLITHFLSAHNHYQNNDVASAKSQVTSFIDVIGSSQWNLFMFANPGFERRWQFLGQNQRVWLNHAFQDDPEYVFAPIWFSTNETPTLTDLEIAFFETEEMLTNQFTQKAKQSLSNINKNLTDIEFRPEDRTRLTRMRRILNALIDQETALQFKTVFALLQRVIEIEVGLYPTGDPIREEIVLENAQDILKFLKKFIEDRTARDINQTLVNSYSFLEIDQIEKKLGRAIFNQSEKETIRLVQFVKSEDLTDSERAQIAKDKSLRDLIQDRFAALEDDKDQIETEIFDANTIDTQEKFKAVLDDARVFTEGMRIDLKNATSNPTFVFSGAFYGDQPMSGTFRIDNQVFNLLSIGGKRETFVNPKVLGSILRRVEKEIEEDRLAKALEAEYAGPSNNTPLAILQRKLVRDTFDQEGLKVNRDNVQIISNDYNEFEVTDALMGKEYRLNFIYFQEEEYVTNLVVEYVRNRFEFGSEIIPRKGLKDFITDAVLARFEAGDTDPETD